MGPPLHHPPRLPGLTCDLVKLGGWAAVQRNALNTHDSKKEKTARCPLGFVSKPSGVFFKKPPVSFSLTYIPPELISFPISDSCETHRTGETPKDGWTFHMDDCPPLETNPKHPLKSHVTAGCCWGLLAALETKQSAGAGTLSGLAPSSQFEAERVCSLPAGSAGIFSSGYLLLLFWYSLTASARPSGVCS